MTLAEFLTALWGTSPPGMVQLWSAGTKKSTYLHDLSGPPPHDLNLTDLYVGVGLSPTAYRANQRCKAQDVAGIAGLWLDVDIAPDKCPDISSAFQVANALAEPTIVVHSGGGLHVWHLLETPFAIGDSDTRSKVAILADAWVSAHQSIAAGHGWKIDSVKDLARLLRVPGTLNGKTDPPRPVETETDSGPRYTLHALNELVKDQVPAALARHKMRTQQQPVEIGPFRTSVPPSIDPELFADLASLVPEFAATWGRQRPEFKDDQSTYDMSLAHWGLEAGWDDQQIVDLLRTHRLKHNPGDPKAGRADYYARTLATARRSQDQTRRREEQRRLVDRIQALKNGEAA